MPEAVARRRREASTSGFDACAGLTLILAIAR